LKESLSNLRTQIEENSTFNTLRERYQTLPASGQKGIQAGAIVLILLVLFMIPYSYFSSSWTYVEDFESNRQMIRELLAASRNSRLPPPLPPAQTSLQLESRVRGVLDGMRLIPEQIAAITPLGDRPAGGLVPPAISQSGVSVDLRNLNLTQIVDIGQRLQNLDAGTKMMGLEIKASTDKENYFNVLFKVVNFSIEIATSSDDEKPGKKPPGRGR
ncbi:MAG: hypothetical protein KDD22_08945, partial [Bdellovibrionales bacterium]|nr:hypothetical protein [Bdellovibrionales bacterium]